MCIHKYLWTDGVEVNVSVILFCELLSGYVPNDFLVSMLIPIVNDHGGDEVSSFCNFRGIIHRILYVLLRNSEICPSYKFHNSFTSVFSLVIMNHRLVVLIITICTYIQLFYILISMVLLVTNVS
jgi:hypothetical protein